MGNRDDLEHTFRSATREVQGEPVRWSRVKRRTRRLRFLAVLLFTIGVVAIAAVLSLGFVVGKKAVDPTYQPPLFASASTGVDFGESGTGRGHTRLGEYLQSAGLSPSGTTRARRREEGFVFVARIHISGFQRDRLRLSWAMHADGSGRRLPATTRANPLEIRPRAQTASVPVQVWISYPRRTGRYQVELTLRNRKGEVVDQSWSRPFRVLAPRVARPYRTPGYEALLPVAWHFATKYVQAGPDRFVTRMLGPNGLSILIDTTRHTSGDPADSARYLEGLLRVNPSYRRREFRRVVLAREPVFEWSFEVDGVRRTDLLFFRGQDGFGVLAEGPRERAREIRAVAREVASSISPLDSKTP